MFSCVRWGAQTIRFTAQQQRQEVLLPFLNDGREQTPSGPPAAGPHSGQFMPRGDLALAGDRTGVALNSCVPAEVGRLGPVRALVSQESRSC